MSELIKGLAQIKANQEAQKQRERERQEAQNRPKADWFKWPDNVDTVHVTFLKEFDESAKGYTPGQNGLAVIAVEHQAPGPKGYLRRGMCTRESEGQCYPDERHALRIEEDEGGWRPRQNLYVDVLADFGDGDKKHLLIQRNANSSFAEELIDEAVESNTITDKVFRIKKMGSGTKTSWSLKKTDQDPFDLTGVEPYNLEEVALRRIPYEKQADYYGAVYRDTPAESGEPAKDSSPEDEW